MYEGKTVRRLQRLGPRSSSLPLLAQVQLEIHKAEAAAAAETLSVGRNLAPSLFPVPSHTAAAVPLHFCGVALWRLFSYLAFSRSASPR